MRDLEDELNDESLDLTDEDLAEPLDDELTEEEFSLDLQLEDGIDEFNPDAAFDDEGLY